MQAMTPSKIARLLATLRGRGCCGSIQLDSTQFDSAQWESLTTSRSLQAARYEHANDSTVKGAYMQKFRLLLLSAVSICLLAVPASAGQLASWKFDAGRNRLDFKTDAGVQPKAVLLFNPTRLVIDLPGISFPKSTITQKLTGNFRSLRVGQFDGGTARLVLELQPGYTLNPKQVRFTGENPIDWYVSIPVPERGSTTLPTLSPKPTTSPK
jgi:N-acetylmuramoyl-L-alanine amidase